METNSQEHRAAFLNADLPDPVVQALRVLAGYVPDGFALEFNLAIMPTILPPDGQARPIGVEKLIVSKPSAGRVVHGQRRATANGRRPTAATPPAAKDRANLELLEGGSEDAPGEPEA